MAVSLNRRAIYRCECLAKEILNIPYDDDTPEHIEMIFDKKAHLRACINKQYKGSPLKDTILEAFELDTINEFINEYKKYLEGEWQWM